MLTVIWNFLVRIWMSISFPLLKRTTTHNQSVEEIEISQQAAFLCQKYIEARFTRSQLCIYNPKSRNKNRSPSVVCSEDVVRTLCEIGTLLENNYPKLYNNVLDQLNFRITLGILVCHMFNRVCEQIVASGVSWSRIVAVYAFAGALAYDFTQAGDTRFVRSVADWMGHFSAKRLSPWIRQNGGWVSGLNLWNISFGQKVRVTNVTFRSVVVINFNLCKDSKYFCLFHRCLRWHLIKLLAWICLNKWIPARHAII